MLKEFILKKFDEKNRTNMIRELSKKYKFLHHGVLSKTLCQRDIDYIRVGNIENPPVLFVGATHGMEWITSSLLLHFLEDVCHAIDTCKKIVGVNLKEFFESNALIIVPCLNPDGVEIQINGVNAAKKYSKLISKLNVDAKTWQSNARGVDLNHNFDADWRKARELEQKSNVFGPGPTRYGGEKPFSEPESQAIRNICNKIDFRHVISFHSQGREIFWDYANIIPQGSLRMAQIISASSGYVVSKPIGTAVCGGLKDWFIQEFNRPGFTIEVGLGENPLPISDLPQIFKELFEAMVLGTIM
ncbi:MAG: M14 family metallocarboxypeptidase [Oscillospiraceae bacterium]|nr:M14 family metallocarboxypeptidase [Oscillospiraceae bacterium]